MTGATGAAMARPDARSREIAAALRGEWRMIGSVSLRPCKDADGFEAALCLDPIVLKGSLEQQGYPRTAGAAQKVEARRLAELDRCVERLNQRLPEAERIKAFSVIG
ncbi:MAG: hypothetical protein JST08_04745 [Actinobacteria bacterium]|nr:hypothetical protein [Actinomycetota bacterium]